MIKSLKNTTIKTAIIYLSVCSDLIVVQLKMSESSIPISDGNTILSAVYAEKILEPLRTAITQAKSKVKVMIPVVYAHVIWAQSQTATT